MESILGIDYKTIVFQDDCSGTPDNWTNANGGAHSFSSGIMSFIDDNASNSEYIYKDIVLTKATYHFNVRFRYTSLSSTPVLVQLVDSSINLFAGFYIDSATSKIYGWNGAGWTDTGATLAINTWVDIDIAGNTTTKKYSFKFGSVSGSGYSSHASATTLTKIIIGGGSGGGVETYEIDYLTMREGFSATPVYNPYKDSIGRFFQGDPTLRGYWQLDGSAIDNSGNSNNGAVTAITYSPINNKKAAAYNGTTSRIDCGTDSSLNISNAITIISWVRPDTTALTNFPMLVCKGVVNTAYLLFLSSGAPSLRTKSVPDNIITSSKALIANIDYCVAATSDGTTNSIFVNGTLTGSNVVGGFDANTTRLMLGATGDGTPSNFFSGLQYETAIFNRKMSAQEIYQYYKYATSLSNAFKNWLIFILIEVVFSETITHTDSFIRTIQRIFTSSITHTDTFTSAKIMVMTALEEIIINDDSILRQVNKILIETATHTALMSRGIVRSFINTVTNTATFSSMKLWIVSLLESTIITATIIQAFTNIANRVGVLIGVRKNTRISQGTNKDTTIKKADDRVTT